MTDPERVDIGTWCTVYRADALDLLDAYGMDMRFAVVARAGCSTDPKRTQIRPKTHPKSPFRCRSGPDSMRKPKMRATVARGSTAFGAQKMAVSQRIWKPIFLDALRRTGVVAVSARAAGIDRDTAYKARARSAKFAREWESALNVAADEVEAEIRRRAVLGIEKPIFYQGKQVAAVTEYSDVLLMFLAKAIRPERFRDSHVLEHKGSVDIPPPVFNLVPLERIEPLPESDDVPVPDDA